MQRVSEVQTIVNAVGHQGTFFIKLSPISTFYWKENDVTSEVNKAEIPKGKAFSGSVAVALKGCKLNNDGMQLSPMLSVMQILVTDAGEGETKRLSTCILDDVSDQGIIETERLMLELDY